MRNKENVLWTVAAALLAVLVAYALRPTVRTEVNDWLFSVQKADDSSRYETRKTVEDTARSMVASYESDRQTYEQYHNSASEEKQGWAEQARMRANKTASAYNEYILKNSFVWEDNVPQDIREELPYI